MTPLMRQYRRFAAALIAALLSGCATQEALVQEGQALVFAGKYEAGLEKLSEAAAAEPGNARYRAEYLRQRETAVEALMREGETARAAGKLDEAAAAFARALALGADNARAGGALEAVSREQRHRSQLQQAQASLKKGERDAAAALVRAVLIENPRQRDAQNLQRRIEEERHKEGLSAPVLRSRLTKPVSVQFREAPVRQAFDALSRSTGINFTFDREVRADLRTSIYVANTPVEDVIDLILLPTQLEKKVLSESSVLIYPNTPAKQREYQELAIRSFYLANADVKQTLSMIKTMLKTRDVYIDEKLNLLVMRDTPEAIRLAEKLIAAQDLAEPEVVLEIAVLEVSRSRLTELGVKWPETMSFTVLDPNGTPPLLLSELRGINSDRIAVGPAPSATVTARRTRGDSNLLANPRIRVKNRDKARVLVGDRLPVISAVVTPSTTTPITTETVTYLDVGLKLEVEPNVHLDDDVAIKIGLEVSTASNRRTTQNGTTVYDIGTRNANTTLRLRDGETQVLMGLIRDDDRRTASGVPGLGDLPLLGRLFSSHLDDAQKTEIVLSITPRVVRNVARVDATMLEFWSGTEATLRSQPIMLRPALQDAAVVGPGAASAAPAAAPAAAQPASDMRLSWAGPASARVGEEVTLELRASLRQPMTSASLQFGFDPAVIEVLAVEEAELLKGGLARTTLNHKVDAAAGKVLVSIVRAGEPLSGDGPLLRVRIKPRAPSARAQLQVTLASPVGRQGQPLVATPGEALALTVTGAP
ncbi:MAG TPA: secretin N-terminal domain-containing protein [Burkholderiales bacterium]